MKTKPLYILIPIIVLAAVGLIRGIEPSQKPESLSQTPTQTNSPTTEPTQAPNPSPALSFTLTELATGKIVDASHFAGKPTLLKLGTTYCHVCLEEVPEMKQAFQQIGEQSNIAFILIGASESEAKAYQQKHNIQYPIYTDTGSASRTFSVLGTPTHAFLTDQGQLEARRVGFMDSNQIVSVLQEMI